MYRLCLRQAAYLERQGLQLTFQEPMDKTAYMMSKVRPIILSPGVRLHLDACM